MKLSIIIPVYNEKSTIKEVLQRLAAVDLSSLGLEREIIIVDDKSTDGTREILETVAGSQNGEEVRVMYHKENKGKGAAIRTGFTGITGDIVIIQDADLELDPGEYPSLIAPIVEGKTKVVFGSRFTKKVKGINPWTLRANRIFTFFANLFCGARISDVMTCYKVMHRDVVKKLHLCCNRFDIEPEITAKIRSCGYSIYELPVSYSPRDYKSGKKIRFFDGFSILWAIARHGYRSWGFLVVFLALFLNLYGIDWGTPDEERLNLVFGEKEFASSFFVEMEKAREEIYEKIDCWGRQYTVDEKDVLVKSADREIKVSGGLLDAPRSYLLRSYGDDEQHTLACIGNMNPARMDFNPGCFIYGGAYLYPVAAGLKAVEFFKYVNLTSDIKYYFANPGEMGKLFTAGRVVGAVFCALAAYFIFMAGFNLYGWRAGFIGSLLFVITPEIVIFSHYLKPYSLAFLWMAISFYFTTCILKEDAARYPVFAGLFAGISAGASLTSGFVALFIPIAYLVKGPIKQNALLTLKRTLLAATLFIVGIVVVNPYWIVSFKQVISEHRFLSGWWEPEHTVRNLWYYLRYTVSAALGFPLLFSAITGYVYVLFKREKSDILIVPLVTIMFVFFAFSAPKYVHYGIFLVPFFAMLAGRVFDRVLSLKKIFRGVSVAAICIVIFYTFSYSFSYCRIFSQKNVRTLAGEWINANIPPGSSIGLPEDPSPWMTPPFKMLGYELVSTGLNKELIEELMPQYFIISECQWLGAKTLEQTLKILSSYKEIKTFEKIPSFMGLHFRNNDNSPTDWCIPNPKILILRRH